ncbi:glycine/sarcosine/betaine reductase component B subunit [Jonquetella anthropi]|uniref:glycine/sarcosine/betaine reductase component B subunit n=1 Tax=Jonquetella anthropi TaxID=428712 RepID=UPI0001B9139C|nr:glycine/sarcosine/betaine reductase component B subunit [Jonquetella anthropi]EEX48292.1 glycine/sarcosine/betaine reductase component B subunit alpha and beta [Jonquetella anthropi E3_33 E1]
MKLELHKVRINKVVFGDAFSVKNGTLTICKQALIDNIKDDERLASVDVELAHPGESIRIAPVKDAIEPRCKIEGTNEVFPGWIGDVDTVGEGKTLVLEGAAVLTTGRLIAPQEGIVDMTGPGAPYTPFSQTCNIVMVLNPVENLELHSREESCRLAGLKTATFIAQKIKEAGFAADKVETYESKPYREALAEYPNLPKVAYIYMLQTQGLLHDTYVYGVDVKKVIPTMINATEVMDGAICSGNCVSACDKNSTYVHLNNPIIKSLYEHHGKDLNFIGVVITNENVTLADKKRSSSYAVKLAKTLGADAVVISEEGFGNPDADLVLNCWKSEKAGMKTVLVTDEYAARDGGSQSLADTTPYGNACVTAGNANEPIILPKLDHVIGDISTVANQAGGFVDTVRPDGSLFCELQIITGATCELGFTKNGAETL